MRWRHCQVARSAEPASEIQRELLRHAGLTYRVDFPRRHRLLSRLRIVIIVTGSPRTAAASRAHSFLPYSTSIHLHVHNCLPLITRSYVGTAPKHVGKAPSGKYLPICISMCICGHHSTTLVQLHGCKATRNDNT